MFISMTTKHLLVYVSLEHLDAWPVIIMTLQVASLRGAHEGTTCLSYAELTVTDCFCLEQGERTTPTN